MMISSRSLRNAAAGALGAGAVAGALMFGGAPVAQAAPAPTHDSSFAVAGPHGGAGFIPDRPGGGWGGGGHGGGHGGGWGGHGGGWGGHGGWGRGGGWGGHGGWGRGGGGWGHGGWGHDWWGGPGRWWNWWW
jgi:hypothetical protein